MKKPRTDEGWASRGFVVASLDKPGGLGAGLVRARDESIVPDLATAPQVPRFAFLFLASARCVGVKRMLRRAGISGKSGLHLECSLPLQEQDSRPDAGSDRDNAGTVTCSRRVRVSRASPTGMYLNNRTCLYLPVMEG